METPTITVDRREDRRQNGVVRRSLRVSMIDGIFSSMTIGMVESYFVPFALALRATASQIGHLSAVPSLVAALTQSQAHNLTALSGGRKSGLRWVVFLQALGLLAMPAVLLLPEASRVPALLGLVITYMIFGGLASPLWGSMMSEYVPSSRRSGYFGWRNRILGIVLALSSLAAGALLNRFGKQTLAGFALLFGVAGCFRLMSWRMIGRMYEVGIRERRATPRARMANRPFDRRFVRFVVFCGLLAGSINLAAPFFPVYLLNGLHYSYFTYTVLVVGSQAAMYYSMARWGWQADRTGNMKVIRTVAWAMPLISLAWMVRGGVVYFFIVQVASGLIWAGYNLCTTNFIYDALPSEQRVRGTVLFSMVGGFCSFLGAWLGGPLLEWLPPIGGNSFLSLALVSTLSRGLVLLLFLPGVQEVREVPHVRSVDLFYSMIGIRPMAAFIRNVGRIAVRDDG